MNGPSTKSRHGVDSTLLAYDRPEYAPLNRSRQRSSGGAVDMVWAAIGLVPCITWAVAASSRHILTATPVPSAARQPTFTLSAAYLTNLGHDSNAWS